MAGFQRRCDTCACTDKSRCEANAAARGECADFLSWPDFYVREIAVIERSLHNTYVGGGFLMLCIATVGFLAFLAK